MRYQIELTHSKSTHTAVIRGRVRAKELPQFVPAACGEVWSFIRSASLPRPGRHLALYLDAQGSVEVGAEVSEPFAGNDRVHCSQLPAGRVVTATHFGPYARLSEAHAAIRAWCVERGHRCSVISWEIYGHWEESWNADPSKIRTDVFYLLDDAKVAVFVAADDAYARTTVIALASAMGSARSIVAFYIRRVFWRVLEI